MLNSYTSATSTTLPGDERDVILNALLDYKASDQYEEQMRQKTITFTRKHPDCFSRELLVGHITGSAWVVDPQLKQTLLTHHAKLNKWFQLGGHSDGDPDTLAVAHREATEESGLENITILSQEIFDIDIHPIPEKGDEPEHLHYDIRFMFTADPKEELLITDESKDLQWLALDAVSDVNSSESIARMVRKTEQLREAS